MLIMNVRRQNKQADDISKPNSPRNVVLAAQEVFMSIVRLIHIKIDPSEIENAIQVWKTQCAPVMIQQKGCISEKLMRCREAHELISYSEWDTESDIEFYRSSDAHNEIVRHTLKGSSAEGEALRPRHLVLKISPMARAPCQDCQDLTPPYRTMWGIFGIFRPGAVRKWPRKNILRPCEQGQLLGCVS